MGFFSTESIAGASARRPWTVLILWAVLLVICMFLIVRLLGDALTTSADITTNPESKQARALIEDHLRGPQRDNEIVIVQSATATVDDAAYRSFVEKLTSDVNALGPSIIASGRNFYQTNDPTMVSQDRHTTIIEFAMAGTDQDAMDNITKVLHITKSADSDEFNVLIAGNASMGEDFSKEAERDLQKGEMYGIPIALIILALVFGAIAASVIPIVLAIVAIVIAVGLSALIGQQYQLSLFVTNVITMIGLAVGIDYSLFVISRFREERARGLEKLDAIMRAGGTASRTVFFSGMTVIIALLGMLIVPQTIFRSIAIGSVLVAAAAVAASLTLLPAVLSLLGDRVNWGRIPFVQRSQEAFDEQKRGGFWDRLARFVLRYPIPSFLVSAGILLVSAIPFFSINTGFSGVSALPDSLPAKQAYLVLNRDFSAGLVSPAQVVIQGDVNSPAVQQGVDRLRTTLAGDAMFGEVTYEANDAGDLALVEAPINADPNTGKAEDAVQRLRDDYVPQSFGDSDAKVLVGGFTAENIDAFDMLATYTPIVFAFVLGLSFILLLIVFRSIVVPIKAVIMNLLSVGAAYGLLVLVTQQGFAAGLFGFQQVEKIEAWLPIFLFAILFGLSMDYHVFLLSRIREHYDRTHNNGESIVFGVRTTGRLITGAALIMVAVFAGFASGNLVMFQEMGFGAGVAVLLDATIVRSILVPASMALLGDWNWYLPRWLQWLPDVRVEAGEPAPAHRGVAPEASPSG